MDLADEARQVPEADARGYAGAVMQWCGCGSAGKIQNTFLHAPLCVDVLGLVWARMCNVLGLCSRSNKPCFALVTHPEPSAAPLLQWPAAETGLLYFETSAKSNINVAELFDAVADK